MDGRLMWLPIYSVRCSTIRSDLFIIFNRMTREEKIEAIYAEMANKEVSFGCRYKFIKKYQYCDWAWFEPWDIITLCKRDAKYEDSFLTTFFRDIALIKKDVYDYVEIIWHPVMIGDVLDWIEPYWWVFAQSVNLDIERTRKGTLLLSVRKQKRKPIDDQSDECIDYVYSLIPSKSM